MIKRLVMAVCLVIFLACIFFLPPYLFLLADFSSIGKTETVSVEPAQIEIEPLSMEEKLGVLADSQYDSGKNSFSRIVNEYYGDPSSIVQLLEELTVTEIFPKNLFYYIETGNVYFQEALNQYEYSGGKLVKLTIFNLGSDQNFSMTIAVDPETDKILRFTAMFPNMEGQIQAEGFFRDPHACMKAYAAYLGVELEPSIDSTVFPISGTTTSYLLMINPGMETCTIELALIPNNTYYEKPNPTSEPLPAAEAGAYNE